MQGVRKPVSTFQVNVPGLILLSTKINSTFQLSAKILKSKRVRAKPQTMNL